MKKLLKKDLAERLAIEGTQCGSMNDYSEELELDRETLIDLDDTLDETIAVTETERVFAFDDQPIEAFLNDSDSGGPSSADYFLVAEGPLCSIREAVKQDDIPKAIEAAGDLGSEEVPLSNSACLELLSFVSTLISPAPFETPPYDISGLGRLLGRISDLARERAHDEMQKLAWEQLERWYAKQRLYREGGRVILKLIALYRKQKEISDMAGKINDYGFSCMLDGKPRRAMFLFGKAAAVSIQKGHRSRYANARANYWLCRIESDEPVDLDEVEAEIETYADALLVSSYWQARKIHLLRARVAQGRGRLDSAIEHVEKAIALTCDRRSEYTQMDTNYLDKLQKRLAMENQKYSGASTGKADAEVGISTDSLEPIGI